MKTSLEIRLLRKDDDRSSFSCGQPDLDRFFRHYAGQNQFRLRIAVTHVALHAGRIVGFATVAVGSLEREVLPSPRQRKRMPGYPLPVLRLARLGVDKEAQGLGVGSALLAHVLRLALGQSNMLGCIGVVADAKPDAFAFYERYGFRPIHGVLEGKLHGDPTPVFLSIETIAASIHDQAYGKPSAPYQVIVSSGIGQNF